MRSLSPAHSRCFVVAVMLLAGVRKPGGPRATTHRLCTGPGSAVGQGDPNGDPLARTEKWNSASQPAIPLPPSLSKMTAGPAPTLKSPGLQRFEDAPPGDPSRREGWRRKKTMLLPAPAGLCQVSSLVTATDLPVRCVST